MNPGWPERTFTFLGGTHGGWRIERIDPVQGETLPPASHLEIRNSLHPELPTEASWSLRGVTSNERYTTRDERRRLTERQPPLGRHEAVCGALIPIRKNPTWWTLTQEERREILERRSEHIKTGLRYLPAIARRLHHCRDLGESFDFITWFEFAPEHSDDFERLVNTLRATEEWVYVDREVDVRVTRIAP